MNRSTPDLLAHHQLQEFTQTHVHRVGDAIVHSKLNNNTTAKDSVPLSFVYTRRFNFKKLYLIHCGDLNGQEIQERGDMHTFAADSFCITVKINTTSLSSYTPIKINLKTRKCGFLFCLAYLGHCKISLSF